MILYSQTNQKRFVDQHYKVSVTMVTHGARGEGGTLNEAIYTDRRPRSDNIKSEDKTMPKNCSALCSLKTSACCPSGFPSATLLFLPLHQPLEPLSR